LAESPPAGALELEQLRQNQLAVARNGRDPALALWCGDRMPGLSVWAGEILDAMEPVCALLDASCDGHAYTRALAAQREKVMAPELTPSARILAAMRAADEPFFRYALQVSLAHRDELLDSPYAEPARLAALRREAAASQERQREIEAADELDFESYLARYFA
jgi:glutamate--cysteine ligase